MSTETEREKPDDNTPNEGQSRRYVPHGETSTEIIKKQQKFNGRIFEAAPAAEAFQSEALIWPLPVPNVRNIG